MDRPARARRSGALSDRDRLWFYPRDIAPIILSEFAPGQVPQRDPAVQLRGRDLVIYTEERRAYRILFDSDDQVVGLDLLEAGPSPGPRVSPARAARARAVPR